MNNVLKVYNTIEFHLVIPKHPKKLFSIILKEIKSIAHSENIFIHHNLTKKELYKNILSSDFLVIPSYSEGFCFVAAETEALGTAIVSSNKGALQEVVRGKHINIKSLNSDALSDAIHKALKNEWTIEKSIKFTLTNSVERYINLYKEILNGK